MRATSTGPMNPMKKILWPSEIVSGLVAKAPRNHLTLTPVCHTSIHVGR